MCIRDSPRADIHWPVPCARCSKHVVQVGARPANTLCVQPWSMERSAAMSPDASQPTVMTWSA
eukprot:3103887-Pyramimonas_sp.AAC.1